MLRVRENMAVGTQTRPTPRPSIIEDVLSRVNPRVRDLDEALVARVTLLVLRVAMGWFIFYAGWEKVNQAGGWSAGRFLLYATSGPFTQLFHFMAYNSLVDASVIGGEFAIGLALMLGIATRFSALSGVALFAGLYMAHLPPVDGWVSMHFIYMVVLVALAGGRAGSFYGVDALLESWEERLPILRLVLG